MAYASVLEVKCKFDAEFRRFSIEPDDYKEYERFRSMIERLYHLDNIPFVVQYVEPKNADLLPINNNENFAVALKTTWPILRILIQRKGESYGELFGYASNRSGRSHKSAASALRSFSSLGKTKLEKPIMIENDFRLVSSILDVDKVPRTMRRVRLVRSDSKQFGLYIRTGFSLYHTVNGYERVPAFFVSRLDKDGVAAGTGLLSVDDEIIEVNGIEVIGKSIDQVNDMMVANSHNLVITVRPANQATCLLEQPVTAGRPTAVSSSSAATKNWTTTGGTAPSGDVQRSQSTTPLLQVANGVGSRTAGHLEQRTTSRDRMVVTTTSHRPYDDVDESDEELTTGMITL